MRNFFKSFAKDESGATAIEYGLIAALLSVAIIAAITSVKNELDTTYRGVAAGLAEGNGSGGTEAATTEGEGTGDGA